MCILFLKAEEAKEQQKTNWRRLDDEATIYKNTAGQKTQE